MTAERPKCIDGECCNSAPDGHLLVSERRIICGWYFKLLRWNESRGRPTRCAACRRDFPNEEVPK